MYHRQRNSSNPNKNTVRNASNNVDKTSLTCACARAASADQALNRAHQKLVQNRQHIYKQRSSIPTITVVPTVMRLISTCRIYKDEQGRINGTLRIQYCYIRKLLLVQGLGFRG
jgi:uncharacterized protein YecT (DUF1311 family)